MEYLYINICIWYLISNTLHYITHTHIYIFIKSYTPFIEDLGNEMVVGPPREVIKKTRPSLVQQAVVHAVNSRRQVGKQPGYGDGSDGSHKKKVPKTTTLVPSGNLIWLIYG